MNIQKFFDYFGFKLARIKSSDYYTEIDSWLPMPPSYYRNMVAETFELEIERNQLEYMAKQFEQMRLVIDKEQEEFHLRRQHPGLEEAYSKYKMLVELYK